MRRDGLVGLGGEQLRPWVLVTIVVNGSSMIAAATRPEDRAAGMSG